MTRRTRHARAYVEAVAQILKIIEQYEESSGRRWVTREMVEAHGHRKPDVSRVFSRLQKEGLIGRHYRPTVPSDIAYERRFPITIVADQYKFLGMIVRQENGRTR